MRKSLSSGEVVRCPWCVYEYPDDVEDFVVPFQVGLDSRAGEPESCPECHKCFFVERVKKGKYVIVGVDCSRSDDVA